MKSGPTSDSPPRELVEAFKAIADKALEPLAAFVTDEGFDVDTVRVLAVWSSIDAAWSAPARSCPDDGRPTHRAWLWLMSGLEVDYSAIAEATGLSRSTARQKVAVLMGARAVFPDGDISKPARAALQAAVAERVGGRKRAQAKPEPKAKAN